MRRPWVKALAALALTATATAATPRDPSGGAWTDVPMGAFTLTQQDGGELPLIQGRRITMRGVDTDGSQGPDDYAESTATARGPCQGVTAALCFVASESYANPAEDEAPVLQIEFNARLSNGMELAIELADGGEGLELVAEIGHEEGGEPETENGMPASYGTVYPFVCEVVGSVVRVKVAGSELLRWDAGEAVTIEEFAFEGVGIFGRYDSYAEDTRAIPLCRLEVRNGSGSGVYAAGTVVSVAVELPAGQGLHAWEAVPPEAAANLADPSAAETTFTMPAQDVILTPVPATIDVVAPGAGETWWFYTTHEVRWTSAHVEGGVIIEVSGQTPYASGLVWDALDDSAEDDGSFTWLIPNLVHTLDETTTIRVRSRQNPEVYGTAVVRTIEYCPLITITSPTADEVYYRGDVLTITWEFASDPGQEQRIDWPVHISLGGYSGGGPGSYTINPQAPNTGSYEWSIPTGFQLNDFWLTVQPDPTLNLSANFPCAGNGTQGWFYITARIPDPNLEAALHRALGVPVGRRLTHIHFGQLTDLDAAAAGITDLTGLEHCHSLRTINLAYNDIRDLQPLLQNAGVGPGDTLILIGSPLSDTARTDQVPALEARGVGVILDAPTADITGPWHHVSYYVDPDLDYVGLVRGGGSLNGTYAWIEMDSGGYANSRTAITETRFFPDGTVTAVVNGGEETLQAHRNAGENLIVGAEIDAEADFSLTAFVKPAADHHTADLAGTWHWAELYLGSDMSFVGYTQARGSLNGSVTYESVDSDGDNEAGTVTSSSTVDADGGVLMSFAVDGTTKTYPARMNASRDVIVGVTAAGEADEDWNLVALVKQGASYSAADLEGTWALAQVFVGPRTGGGLDYVGYTSGTGFLNGAFSRVTVDSDGETETGSVTLAASVSAEGQVTFTVSTGVTFTGWMNASKDVIIHADNADGDYNSGILVKLPAAGESDHDDFANALTLTGWSGQTTDSNAGATKQTGEPNHAGNPGGASVWWEWTAPASGSVTFDTLGSDFDTLLGVYLGGAVDALTCVASNDDTDGEQSRVTFDAVSGTTYRIAADGRDGATGNIVLNWLVEGNLPAERWEGTWRFHGYDATADQWTPAAPHNGFFSFGASVVTEMTITKTGPGLYFVFLGEPVNDGKTMAEQGDELVWHRSGYDEDDDYAKEGARLRWVGDGTALFLYGEAGWNGPQMSDIYWGDGIAGVIQRSAGTGAGGNWAGTYRMQVASFEADRWWGNGFTRWKSRTVNVVIEANGDGYLGHAEDDPTEISALTDHGTYLAGYRTWWDEGNDFCEEYLRVHRSADGRLFFVADSTCFEDQTRRDMCAFEWTVGIEAAATTVQTYALNVTADPALAVVIASDTGHGGTTAYARDVPAGTAVTLTAPLYVGQGVQRYRFQEWTGDMSGAAPTLMFEMSGLTSVAAVYLAAPAPEPGGLVGFGANAQGQLGLCGTRWVQEGVAEVAAGSAHSLYVRDDGSLWAMGGNWFGQLGDGTTTDRPTPVQIESGGVLAVAAGSAHSLYVKDDGSLWAMGHNRYGQLGDGTTTDRPSPVRIESGGVLAVAAGEEHSLYVKDDGSLWATGRNADGQLGDGTTTDRPSPVRVESGGVAAVTAGLRHSLYVKDDDSLWAMGYNGYGQLGDGTTTDRPTPVRIQSGGVLAVAAGWQHSLYVKDDGSLWAMGGNQLGQLGDGTTSTIRLTPVRIESGGVSAVAAGDEHSLFVKTDGSLWAMGDNWYGQLGDGTTVDRPTPVQIESGGVSAVAAGDEHSLYVKDGGSLWAMGYNGDGQLGDGSTNEGNHHLSPVRIQPDGVAAVAAAGEHSLFVEADGSLWAMGHNGYGQLGDGTTENRATPARVESGGVLAVAAGGRHSLYVKDDGSLWAMGRNDSGQLGDGTTENRVTPVRVESGGVTAVAAAGEHSLFVKTDGSLWAMGHNGYGQLGDGTTENRATPVRVMEARVTAVAAGDYHSLYVKDDGSLWAIGHNGCGQLGDGTTENRATPVRVESAGVRAVAARGSHSLYVKTDGSLWAMGGNWYGQLGDGSVENRPTPVRIESGGVLAVAAGGEHSLYVKDDGSLWAMGYNGDGQLGDGTTESHPTPVRVIEAGVTAIAAGIWHSLAILSNPPAWTNPVGQAHSMAVYAKVLMRGVSLIERGGSLLAAFKDGVCRGVASIGAGPGGLIWSLQVFSDVTTETGLTFRVWDAATSQVYDVAETLDFAAGSALGSPESPLVLHAGGTGASLAVRIEPPEAAAAGAGWSIDDGATWHADGVVLPELQIDQPVMAVTVTFRPRVGWDPPPPQVVYVVTGAPASATGTYTRRPHVIDFAVLPATSYGAAPFTLFPTASSGLPVTLVSSNPTVATVVRYWGGWQVTVHNAGSATLTASQAGDATWPAALPVSHLLTVARAPLICQAGDATRPYGHENPPFTLTYSGFVAGDGPAGLDTAPSLFCNAAAGSPVGTYEIMPQGGNDDSYSFLYVPGALTVLGGGPPEATVQVTVDAAAVALGRGWWNLTGHYAADDSANSFAMSLVHDANGRLSGTATYAVAEDLSLALPIRGISRGVDGNVVLKGALRVVDKAIGARASLTLDLTLDAENRRLVGWLTGRVVTAVRALPVAQELTLAVPQDIDGTWTLRCDLDQVGRRLTGTAVLGLANQIEHLLAVAGKQKAADAMLLSLSGRPTDPVGKAVRIRTTITPSTGSGATIEGFSGRGYGQVLRW